MNECLINFKCSKEWKSVAGEMSIQWIILSTGFQRWSCNSVRRCTILCQSFDPQITAVTYYTLILDPFCFVRARTGPRLEGEEHVAYGFMCFEHLLHPLDKWWRGGWLSGWIFGTSIFVFLLLLARSCS